jgi:hypothetical protein
MNFSALKKDLEGEFFTDETTRRLYATDASAYREIPQAVAIPKSNNDLLKLIQFAAKNKTSVIPRTAGTSLAGQVVGGGIVVDVSKNFNRIIEVNAKEQWAIVEPGIVRDDLNQHLKSFGFFFAPETSTANRAMIGGMIGNNSCGSKSMSSYPTEAMPGLVRLRAMNSPGVYLVIHWKINCISTLTKLFHLLKTLLRSKKIFQKYRSRDVILDMQLICLRGCSHLDQMVLHLTSAV